MLCVPVVITPALEVEALGTAIEAKSDPTIVLYFKVTSEPVALNTIDATYLSEILFPISSA